jgi:CrcB protein
MASDMWILRVGCVALAGAIGAVSRWGVTHVVHYSLGESAGRWWFLGTLTVNALGCFLFGFAIDYFQRYLPQDETLRLAVTAGFLGAFTTFSTFAYETVKLHTSDGLLWAAANVGLSVVVGLIAVVLGAATVRGMS